MPVQKLYLKAGQTLQQSVAGLFLQYIAGVSPIFIRKDGESFDEYWPGNGTGSGAFTSFEVRNPAAFDVEIWLWVDRVEWLDNRRDNVESPTEAVGRAFTSIAASGLVDLLPDLTAPRIRRKAITVTNLDATVSIFVSDSSSANAGRGNIIAAVFPQSSVILPISEPCRLRNDTGAAVSCAVGDVYWLR